MSTTLIPGLTSAVWMGCNNADALTFESSSR